DSCVCDRRADAVQDPRSVRGLGRRRAARDPQQALASFDAFAALAERRPAVLDQQPGRRAVARYAAAQPRSLVTELYLRDPQAAARQPAGADAPLRVPDPGQAR